MKDVEQLIGGYATGTLTDQERDALFTAALHNQELFDALADEEALRDLLADPAARRKLLGALEQHPASLFARFAGWFVYPMAITTAVAALLLGIVTIPRLIDRGAQEQVAMAPATPKQAPSGFPPGADPAAPQKEIAEKSGAPPQEVRPSAPQERRDAAAPPEPARAAAPPVAREQARVAEPAGRAGEREVAGGVVGGVIGGVARPLESPTPPPPQTPARSPVVVQSDLRQEPAAPPATLAKSAASVAAPFDYTVERETSPGTWSAIDPAAPVETGSAIRLAIQPRAAGFVQVRMTRPGGVETSLFLGAVQTGRRLIVPAASGLPAAAGEQRLTIDYARGAPVFGGRPALAFRQPAPVDESKRKNESALRDESDTGAYSVTIPLRFR